MVLAAAVLPALASSLAYSTDAVVVRSALEKMPMPVFLFILAGLYALVALGLWLWRGQAIASYLSNKANRHAIRLALVGLVLGTIVADGLMYVAIQSSTRTGLPLTIALVHTTPLLSLLLVWLAFGKAPNWKVCAGIVLSVGGCLLAIMHSDPSDV